MFLKARLRRAATVVLATATSAVALFAQTSGPPLPKGTHVLVGRVTEISSDAPVAGAIVTLTGYFDHSGKAVTSLPQTGEDTPTAAPKNAMTTPDGYFVFHDLPTGHYSLAATAFGYQRSEYPPHVVDVADSAKPSSASLRLWRFASISGTIIDEHGEPVVGVPVSALHCETLGGGLALRREAEVDTDDRGVYRFSRLTPGNYVVGVLSSSISMPAGLADQVSAGLIGRGPTDIDRAVSRGGLSTLPISGDGIRMGNFVFIRRGPQVLSPGGGMLGYQTTLYPGASGVAEASVLVLGSGESREGVDLSLRFQPMVQVSGVVTGPDGPMANQAVRLVPPNAADITDRQPAGVETALTDATGAFTFPAVPAGQYLLESTFNSYGDPRTPGSVDISLWASRSLTVADDDVRGVSLSLQPTARLHARLQFKGPAAPTSSDMRGVAMLWPIGSQSNAILPTQLSSSDDITLLGGPPGRYVLIATWTPSMWNLLTVARGNRILADDVVELDSTDINDLVLTFSKTATHISGVVADAKGNADPDTDVVAFPADTTAWRQGLFPSTHRIRVAHATSTRAFEFIGLAPGEYYRAAASARLTTTWDDPACLERLIPGATRVSIADGENRTVSLKTQTLSIK